MLPTSLKSAVLALAAASWASAQTFTECDPTKEDCDPDPALATTVHVNFADGASDLFEVSEGSNITYSKDTGAAFIIKNETRAPTISSNKFIFFGRVDVTCRAAPGVGVVTSVVLQSDCLDEIDWEWLGGDTTQVQSNYFSKGNTTTYDRAAFHQVSSPQTEFHTYSIDWTPEAVSWIIDGVTVRTLTYQDANGGATYPQTPMKVKLGTWVAGGEDAPEGTVQWAGGYTDFKQAPFIGYYMEATVTDYSNGVQNAKEYIYSDRSGTYQSINVSTTSSSGNTGSNQQSPAVGLPPVPGSPSRYPVDSASPTIPLPSGAPLGPGKKPYPPPGSDGVMPPPMGTGGLGSDSDSSSDSDSDDESSNGDAGRGTVDESSDGDAGRGTVDESSDGDAGRGTVDESSDGDAGRATVIALPINAAGRTSANLAVSASVALLLNLILS